MAAPTSWSFRRWCVVPFLLALVACASQPGSVADEDDADLVVNPHASAGKCGKERWSVKTGTDAQASSVNFTPQDTTIAALGAAPAPASLPASSRISPQELQVYRLTNVTLTQYKLESDSDYHLVLSDGSHSMIAEIPDPACVGAGSAFASRVSASRAAFDGKYTVTPSFQSANIPVTITGAGFFDAPHGQTGVAPNAFELHAILSICFGQDCGGSGGTTPDFALAAAPASIASSNGAAATSSISVSGTGGFSGKVQLSATGLPAGATASFSTASVSAGASSTLTLSPGTASAGTYTVTVNGASGATQHSTTVSWTIARSVAPDFALSVSPSSVSGAGAVNVTVSALNGFSSAVRLAVSGTPSGATAGFNATSISGSGSASLTLQPGTAAAGTYALTISGTSGSLSHTATVSWSISSGGGNTPPVVQIRMPAAGATLSGSVTVVAAATSSGGIASLELYVDNVLLSSAAGGQVSRSWDTTLVANGGHTLSARAWDTAGNAGVAPDVAVTVNNSSGSPGTTTELITNGDFEGSLSGWALAGAKLPIDSSAHSHSGHYAMRMGQDSGTLTRGNSSATQVVSIPADAASATLTFWYYAKTVDTIQYAWQEADLTDANGVVLTQIFKFCDNSQSWTQATVDVSQYAGQTVGVYFNVYSYGGAYPTALWVDSVSLLATTGGGGGGGTPGTDTTPPTVSVTSPANGATVSGAVALRAVADDNVGVTRVDFLVDGVQVATAAAPLQASWDSTSVADGAHTLSARATDAAGNTGTSSIVSVTVQNGGSSGDTTPPTTSLTAPRSGATVSGAVTLSATASDNVGVARVEFLIDGAVVATSTAAPYSATWDSTTVANGAHSVSSRAWDAAGNTGSSAAVSVTVQNGGTTAPTVSITTPSNGSTISGTATISATASAGVTRVEFDVDGAAITTDTVAPWSTTWNTTSVSNGAHTLTARAFDAAGNTGTSAAVNVTINNGTSSGLHTVFLIVMENHNWSQIAGSSSAPYINNTLLPQAAYALNYQNAPGIHPSEPNYLWLEAGTNFGVLNDNPPSSNHQSTTQHLVTLLNNAGLSWKSYQEGISGSSCPLASSGLYAPKHNPMVFFDDITNSNSTSSQTCIQHVRPFTELASDLSTNTVARYNFITPNLCDDMHGATGCPSDLIKAGDTFLSQLVPQITASSAYKNGGVIFITWDESEGGDLPIGMIVLSPQGKGGGYTNSIAYTHSSTLRTVEEIFQVSPMLGDAANASDLSDLFKSFP